MPAKIIKGKLYDTERATMVSEWSNWFVRTDPRFVWEQLYVTASGAWFLNGGGGCSSIYAVQVADGSYAPSTHVIRPISPEDAQTWLENKGTVDQCLRHFGHNVQEA